MAALALEWFWFLLPIATLSGWYIGSRKKLPQQSNWQVAPEYIASLNDLLNQKTEKAIETLIRFFEVNASTIDTHIMLGNLFREKGELEKATKIHQNIVQKNNARGEVSIHAMLELGRDYLCAGLLDSAEDAFSEVAKCDSRSAARTACRNLCSIYETEKLWEKAIERAKYLKAEGNEEYALRIVHYQNELAEEYLAKKDYSKAKHWVALAKSSQSILRTVIVDGDIEFMKGNHPTAMHLYSTALSQWPEYVQIILPKLKACFSDPSEFANHLHEIMPEVMTSTYVTTYTKALLASHRSQEAKDFASEMIKKNCVTVPMLKVFIEYGIEDQEFNQSDFMPYLIQVLRAHKDDDGFMCSDCGFKGVHFQWQCPSCHIWEKIKPLDLIESNISKPSAPFVS